MPLLSLHEICRTGSENEASDRTEYVVVLKIGAKPVAVAVDALLEQQEIVVKSLSGHAGRIDGVAGASILGDGRIVLILDVFSLVWTIEAGTTRTTELERIAP